MGKYSHKRARTNQFKNQKWKKDKYNITPKNHKGNKVEVCAVEENSKWKQEYNNYLLGTEKKRKEADYLLQKYKPKNLYKYISLESKDSSEESYAIKNLKDSVLTFQSPLNFNDPYDSLANFQIDRSKVDIIKTLISDNNLIFKEVFKGETFDYTDPSFLDRKVKKQQEKLLDIFCKFINNFRICCFTERNDSILMWSHYANYHKGICIEYDFDKLNEQYKNKIVKQLFDISFLDELYPIVYGESFVTLDNYNNNIKRYVIKAMTTKYIDWRYENEWRIITSSVRNRIKAKNGFELRKVPKPTAIYMGCKINNEDRVKIIDICKERKISLYEMNMNPSNFRLEQSPIILVINNEIFKYSLRMSICSTKSKYEEFSEFLRFIKIRCDSFKLEYK